MNMHTYTSLFRRLLEPIAAAPSTLAAYTGFAVFVTFVDYILLLLAPEPFRSRLVPYIGWLASMFYSFTLYFAFALIYQRKGRRLVRFGITLPLLLSILFGACQYFQRTGETFGNPYLTISPWRPVWTILIPCIWIIMLHSPRINRFCRQTDEPHVS